VIRLLEEDGYRTVIADHRDPYFGGVSALSPLGGGADPRRSGFVIML
jgi:gamma-glutamyltranspeptidase / glutathione hydrolase